jgi:elongation factor G
VKAEIPLAETLNYSAELKALTAGEGFYSMELSHYAPVPNHLAAPVIAAAKSRQVHEADE